MYCAFHDLRFSYLRWEAVRGTGENDSTLRARLWQMAKKLFEKGLRVRDCCRRGDGVDTSKTGI